MFTKHVSAAPLANDKALAIIHTPSARFVVAGDARGRVVLVAPNLTSSNGNIDNTPIAIFTGAHAGPAIAVAILASRSATIDTPRFLSAGRDGRIVLWDVNQTHRCVASIRVSPAPLTALAVLSPNVAVAAGSDASLRFIDVRVPRLNVSMTVVADRSSATQSNKTLLPSDAVTALAIPKSGVSVLATSLDGAVRDFDLRAARVITDFVPPIQGTSNNRVSLVSLDVAQNGDVITNALDSSLRLLQLGQGRLSFRNSAKVIRIIKGHRCKSTAINTRFAFNDSILISGTESNYHNDTNKATIESVCVWDLSIASKNRTIDTPNVVSMLPDRDVNLLNAASGRIRQNDSITATTALTPLEPIFVQTGRRYVAVASPVSPFIDFIEIHNNNDNNYDNDDDDDIS